MGDIAVDTDALWGAQTQRSLEHFAISTERMPQDLLYALARTKRAAAHANFALGLLDADVDLRVGVLENVPLVPRELAVAIQAAGVGLSKTEFESIDIEIKPEVDGVVALTASSFSVDVCAGCLTQPADACSADAQHAFNPIVCRPGQDVPSFTCLDVTIGVAP